MSIEVRSPHNGELVKIMPKDVGKAVKDSDGRIFYVLTDEAGDYYASMTRSPAGAAKDQQRYDRTETRMSAHQSDARQRDAAVRAAGGGGKKSGYLLYLIVGVILILTLAWLFILGPLKGMLDSAG